MIKSLKENDSNSSTNLLNEKNYFDWLKKLKVMFYIDENICTTDIKDIDFTTAAGLKKKRVVLQIIYNSMEYDVANQFYRQELLEPIQLLKAIEDKYGSSNEEAVNACKCDIKGIKCKSLKDVEYYLKELRKALDIGVHYDLFTKDSEKIELIQEQLKPFSPVLKQCWQNALFLKLDFDELCKRLVSFITIELECVNPSNNNQSYCTHCEKSGHSNAKCFKLKKMKKTKEENKADQGEKNNGNVKSFTTKAKAMATTSNHVKSVKSDKLTNVFRARQGTNPTPITNNHTEVNNENKSEVIIKTCPVLITEGVNRNDWYIDSGAAYSLTWDKSLFKDYKAINHIYIEVASGHKIPADGIGNVVVNVLTDTGTNNFKLENVLHVPEATYQLLSVSNLAKAGFTTELADPIAKVFDKSGRSIFQGTLDEKVKL